VGPATAGIVGRASPEHRQRLQTPLSGQVAGTLRTMLSAGLMRPVVAEDHAAALVAAGYAHQTLGGFALTDTGMVRAMMENGQ
jgi:hypothetical protein